MLRSMIAWECNQHHYPLLTTASLELKESLLRGRKMKVKIMRFIPKIRNISIYAGHVNVTKRLVILFPPFFTIFAPTPMVHSESIELKGSPEHKLYFLRQYGICVWTTTQRNVSKNNNRALIDFEGDFHSGPSLSHSLLLRICHHITTVSSNTTQPPWLDQHWHIMPEKNDCRSVQSLNQSNSGRRLLHKVLKVCADPEPPVSLCVIISC